MKKFHVKKIVAKGTKNALDKILRLEANSTSCVIAYEPKVPKEISRFKNNCK